MRRALATTALALCLALGGAPLLAAPAYAVPSTADVIAQETDTDVDEPDSNDDEDDSGKWGLLGLTGLLGLFGYKKYQEHRASRPAATNSGPVGDVDGDNSGSRRI